MNEQEESAAKPIEIVDHDPHWAESYAAERDVVRAATGGAFIEFEHIGSTAVPGLCAKPIIDMAHA